ncbi:signal transduction histidine kinase [Clostridiales Family XIII bacterium PM5-7]
MSKRKRYIPLNLKMIVAITVGIILACGMYVLCLLIEDYTVNNIYLSEKAIQKEADEAYAELEKMIKEDDLKATDTKALAKWVKDREYTYFFVYDNYYNVFEAGWWVNESADVGTEQLEEGTDTFITNSEVPENISGRIDESTFESDARNRIVEFTDGKYYTYIDVYKYRRFQSIMDFLALGLSFLTLFAVVLLYNKLMLVRIARLASEVRKISSGDLDSEIHHLHNDEIGTLAISVDNMRNSIIQKHQNEIDAWEANTQLITAMSHDIRTPLTSMIGYLDIIESEKFESEEELKKYISSCRDKAFQLKDLSDKLFQYFLVFGNKENEKSMERFDASILFQQLLAEHGAEIVSYGYKVDLQFNLPEVDVLGDISGLRRLFDNVFSNVMKYADKKFPVGISAEINEENIIIRVTNHIPEETKKVESTRIGLKTCEKICSDLNGRFDYKEEDTVFLVSISFPVAEKE